MQVLANGNDRNNVEDQHPLLMKTVQTVGPLLAVSVKKLVSTLGKFFPAEKKGSSNHECFR